MTSPFASFFNAILTFKVSDGNYTTNSVGNITHDTANLIIKAILKPTKDASAVTRYSKEIQEFTGADGHASLFEGYLVDPTIYPEKINFLTEVDAEIITVINKIESGRFKLLPVSQSPYIVSLNIAVITPIRGIFRRN